MFAAVCDNCLFFPFDDHFDDVHCNQAITTVVGDVTRVPGKKGDGAYFDGDSRLVVNLFKGWLEVRDFSMLTTLI